MVIVVRLDQKVGPLCCVVSRAQCLCDESCDARHDESAKKINRDGYLYVVALLRCGFGPMSLNVRVLILWTD